MHLCEMLHAHIFLFAQKLFKGKTSRMLLGLHDDDVDEEGPRTSRGMDLVSIALRGGGDAAEVEVVDVDGPTTRDLDRLR